MPSEAIQIIVNLFSGLISAIAVDGSRELQSKYGVRRLQRIRRNCHAIGDDLYSMLKFNGLAKNLGDVLWNGFRKNRILFRIFRKKMS